MIGKLRNISKNSQDRGRFGWDSNRAPSESGVRTKANVQLFLQLLTFWTLSIVPFFILPDDGGTVVPETLLLNKKQDDG
jgi:hypothetical protein